MKRTRSGRNTVRVMRKAGADNVQDSANMIAGTFVLNLDICPSLEW